jgi:hypothetical protein
LESISSRAGGPSSCSVVGLSDRVSRSVSDTGTGGGRGGRFSMGGGRGGRVRRLAITVEDLVVFFLSWVAGELMSMLSR